MCIQCGNPAQQHPSRFTRRNFIRLASGVALGMAAPGNPLFAAGEIPKPQNVLTPEEAWKRLRHGNERYVQGVMKRHDFSADRSALTGGQNPFAGILSCADSRIAPEYAFDSGRGDLFVVRVAGNFLNEDVVASFEYAVKFLGTTLLVVLGHDKCGAVDAAIKFVKDDADLPGHIPYLARRIRPAVEIALPEPGDLLANAIRENVLLTVSNLKTASPIISAAVEKGTVQVVGGIYRLDDGRVEWLP